MTKREQYLEDYSRMLMIRFFEEKVEDIFTSGMLSGTVHTCIGQEAIAVGVGRAFRKTDVITSTHRGHGHFIAKGGDPKRVMAELFGKATGYSGGRGGSQLMADYSIGFMGANGIVGGSIPVATGMALHFKQNRKKRIAGCFLGDGAANQGTFHESLNMASLWKLPVIYLFENNLYAMSTPCSQATAGADIVSKAESYHIPGISIDGNDLLAVIDTVKQQTKQVRAGSGPVLIEFRTYRFSGHSRGDKRHYRTRHEEAEWWKNEPIKRFRRYLMDSDMLTKEEDRQLIKKAKSELREAIKFSKQSPDPDLNDLQQKVYA